MRQHYCVFALWMLQGTSCLKAPNIEDLSWVDLNLVTRKGLKWGPYMLSGRGMYFKAASEGKAKPWVGKFLPFNREHFSNVRLPFPHPVLFPHFTCWYWALGNQCNCTVSYRDIRETRVQPSTCRRVIEGLAPSIRMTGWHLLWVTGGDWWGEYLPRRVDESLSF